MDILRRRGFHFYGASAADIRYQLEGLSPYEMIKTLDRSENMPGSRMSVDGIPGIMSTGFLGISLDNVERQ